MDRLLLAICLSECRQRGEDNYMEETLRSIQDRIREVNWADYETAYGNADEDIPFYQDIDDGHGSTPKVSKSLIDLFSGDKANAMKATHDLWCGLCHQHAYVSSAALPAYDFLLLGLQILDDELKFEIIDILYGFVICIPKGTYTGWQSQLRKKMEADKPIFEGFLSNNNHDIAEYVNDIVKEL